MVSYLYKITHFVHLLNQACFMLCWVNIELATHGGLGCMLKTHLNGSIILDSVLQHTHLLQSVYSWLCWNAGPAGKQEQTENGFFLLWFWVMWAFGPVDHLYEPFKANFTLENHDHRPLGCRHYSEKFFKEITLSFEFNFHFFSWDANNEVIQTEVCLVF